MRDHTPNILPGRVLVADTGGTYPRCDHCPERHDWHGEPCRKSALVGGKYGPCPCATSIPEGEQ